MRLWEQLSPDWQKALVDYEAKLDKIDQQLNAEQSINPKRHLIFSALGNSPNDFRVAIIGQDPYPNPEYAMGLAFSVPSGIIPIPPSLKNIQKELLADLGVEIGSDLSMWRDQGVLLLNRILTCESGKSLSHKNFGWQEITSAVLHAVRTTNPNLIAILWGSYAAEVEQVFNPNLVIKSAHPSPLSSHRGFFGSKPFSTANKLLSDTKQLPIIWA